MLHFGRIVILLECNMCYITMPFCVNYVDKIKYYVNNYEGLLFVVFQSRSSFRLHKQKSIFTTN